MTIKDLIEELSHFPENTPVCISVNGKEAFAGQIVWQGSYPTQVIIDDYPADD